MSRSVVLSALVCALVGVSCTPEREFLGSSDVRIDAAPETSDPDSTDVRMCVAGNGSAYVTWVDDRDGASAVWFNTSLDGGVTWLDEAVKINHDVADAYAPDIDCTAAVVHIVWEDARDGELENHNIYYNRSGDGGLTWNAEDTRLTDDVDGNYMHLGPNIVAQRDDLYVAWFDSAAGAFDIKVVGSHDRGQTWNPPVRIDSDEAGSAYSAWPQVDTDGQGHVYVAWEDSRDGGSDIYAASSADGGLTFAPDLRLDSGDEPGVNNSFSPTLSSHNGAVYVVWHDERNGAAGRDIFMSFSNNHGQNWSAQAIRVDSDSAGFFDSIYPDVSVFNGTAYITWQDARSTGYDMYLRSAVAGGFTEAEVRLDTDAAGHGQSLNAQVAVDGQTIVVVWEDRRDDADSEGYNEIYYNYSTDGGLTWAPRDLRVDAIEPGTSYAVDVNIALVQDTLYASWSDGRRGSGDVYFHALPVGEEASYIVE